MDEHFEEQFQKEIDQMFARDPESAKYSIEYNWKLYKDYFLSYFPHSGNSGERLLDVGCGTGLVVKELLPRNFQLYGVDFSIEAINYAKRQGLTIDFRQSSIYHLPFENNMFDVLLCHGVMQSVKDPASALLEMKRVLKPGGLLIIRTLNSLSLSSKSARKHNPWFRFYNPFAFKKEMEKLGFRVRLPKGIYFFGKRGEFLANIILNSGLYKLFNVLFLPIFVFFSHSFYIEAIKHD